MQQLQEDGSYNQLYPKADSYSKNETLTNNTSQMFRIDNGTPEDVFKWLRKYNQYWWEKSQFTISHYEQINTDITEDVYLNGSSDSVPGSYFVWVAKNINVDVKGYMSPADGSGLIISADNTNATQLKDLAPCYVFLYESTRRTPEVYYLPFRTTAGATDSYTIKGNYRYYIGFSASASVKAQKITQKQVTGKTLNTVLVYSKNKDAFSNDGEVSSKQIVTGNSFVLDLASESTTQSVSVSILENLTIDSNNNFTYSVSDTGSIYYNNVNFYNNYCKGHYIKLTTAGYDLAYRGIQEVDPNLIFFVPSNASDVRKSQVQDNPNSVTYYNHFKFTVQPVYVKETQLRDGNYTLLGNPFESFEYNSKIQMGSYIGTGTFGESNKSSLTFPFVPKMVQIVRPTISYQWNEDSRLFYVGQPGKTGGNSYGKAFSVENNTFYYYNDDMATYQCNKLNETYYYIGIGE